MADIIQSQLDESLDPKSSGRLWLRFPPELESCFEADQRSVRIRENIIASLISCLLFDLFLISDYLLDPANIWRCVVLRLLVFTPAAAVAISSVYRWQVKYLCDTMSVAMTVLGAGCVLGIHYNHSSTFSAMAQGGLLVVMSLGTLILRISLPFVVAANLILFCEDAFFLYVDRWMNSTEKLTCVFLVGTFALLSVVARFRSEGLERKYYLLFLRENQRSRRFALLNEDLADLSNRDGLTGLYNRRHFNQHLKRVWELARHDAAPVSIIMVDIDRFKNLNDSYGHLFGDRILAAIANILRSSIRGGEDCIVRFGGDEFVIILPDMDRVQACETAERLCRRVRETTIVSPASEALLSITVSCGVATSLPADMRDSLELLALADQELYRAKDLGRNRVCCAFDSSTAALSQEC
jgi:diguanylate cyclase (GGDEF)-like protein